MNKQTSNHFLNAFVISALVLFTVQFTWSQSEFENLPKGKQTTLELYVSAKQAYEVWKQSPNKVKILDVRTPDEYINIGHASMAWNIPAFIQTYEWDADNNHFSIKVDDIKTLYNEFKNKKIDVVTELMDNRLFFCKDPDGSLIEVKQNI